MILAPPPVSPSVLDDFSPFTRLDGARERGLLLVADHAKADLPPAYGHLGLEAAQFARHIAYDIGIEGVAVELNRLLDVPVVMANFSRLLIDPNRGVDDPTLVMQLSDGALVPGNAQLDQAEITHRLTSYYEPYHQAISAEIAAFLAQDITPVILSLHSFTHQWRGTLRPWQLGVLWDKDPRFAVPLLEKLRSDPGLVVGDNEPYTGQLKGDCMYRHGTGRGLAHGLLEIRQDLIQDLEGQKIWAGRLAQMLSELLAQAAVIAPCRSICHFGSKTDE